MLNNVAVRKLVMSGLVMSGVLVGSNAIAATNFTADAPLVAGQAGSITVNSVPNRNSFIVMPGADFIPTNGNCITNLRLSSRTLPANIWHCSDTSAPIVFSSGSVVANDLVDGNVSGYPYYNNLGYVGFIASSGQSRGAWTVSSPTFMFAQVLASSL
jgi:hypothetical protein